MSKYYLEISFVVHAPNTTLNGLLLTNILSQCVPRVRYQHSLYGKTFLI